MINASITKDAKNTIGTKFPFNEFKGVHAPGFIGLNKFTWGHPEPVTDKQERFYIGHFLALKTRASVMD